MLSPADPWNILAIAAFLLHGLGMGLALHAICRPHSPQGTLSWVVALLLAPAIAIPFYLALGAGRIRARWGYQLAEGQVRHILQGMDQWRTPAQPLQATLLRLTNLPACGGNRVQLLRDGNATYRALEQVIRQAKHSILIEFYIIRNDRVGEALLSLLEEKARSGIRVCVIYDELGSHKLPHGYLRKLRHAGVEVASFNGRRYWWSSFLRLNYRNHRKLVIVDGRHAYIGSANVGLEYLHRSHAPYWRDTFARLRGPIVNHALLGFAEDWQRATGQNISDLAELPEEAGNTCCQWLPSGPDNSPVNIWQTTLLEMAAQSINRLWLTSPYFVPDAAVCGALQTAALRGVDVRILIPRRGDNRLAQLAALSYLLPMLSCGVRILAYTPGMLHEKLAISDNSFCTIGTANLDERSLKLNFELTLLMAGETATQDIANILEQDMKQAIELTPATWYKAPIQKKLAANICRLLAPVL